MKEKKDYYSPQEVADLMGVKVLSVYRWIKEGRIAAVKLGQYHIQREELEQKLGALPVRRQPLSWGELDRMRQELNGIATVEKYLDRVDFSEAEGSISPEQAEELRESGRRILEQGFSKCEC